MSLYIPFQNRHHSCVKVTFGLTLLVAWLAFSGISVWGHGKESPDDSLVPVVESIPQNLGPLTDLVSRGKSAYKHMCAFCHGYDGNGGGKAMSYLYPWPRDFRKGYFKFRSTLSGSLPLDRDIYRVIALGIPGTAMPAWGHSLTQKEIWALVAYIKTFSDRFHEETSRSPISVKIDQPITQESIKKGETIFEELHCGGCHGNDLKGDGSRSNNLYDIWDHRSFVYDLTNPNLYKWGHRRKNIYLTLTAGVDGTPMKSYGHLTEEERWALANFLDSRMKKEAYQPARFENDLYVQMIKKEIPLNPTAEIWDNVPSRVVHLLPLSARRRPINRVKFQSIMNRDKIAFRLQWDDLEANRSSSRHQDFKDAVALQFALGDVTLHSHGHNEPFFGMGNRGKGVNIWQWRADWQRDIETKEKLEYATDGMDVDGMIFGGEVNPVDALNPFRENPVEESNAEGFGTLTVQPQTKQNIQGRGIWKNGTWTVVLSRPLEVLNKWDVKFKIDKETPVLMGMAVWDGSFRDINGRKSVAMWQRLHISEE